MQAALLDEVDVVGDRHRLGHDRSTWNAGAERLYGWTAEEAIGRPVSETVWPAAADPEAFEGQRRCSAATADPTANTSCIAKTARRSSPTFGAA